MQVRVVLFLSLFSSVFVKLSSRNVYANGNGNSNGNGNNGGSSGSSESSTGGSSGAAILSGNNGGPGYSDQSCQDATFVQEYGNVNLYNDRANNGVGCYQRNVQTGGEDGDNYLTELGTQVSWPPTLQSVTPQREWNNPNNPNRGFWPFDCVLNISR